MVDGVMSARCDGLTGLPFAVVSLGNMPGSQCIGRAELCAIIKAAELAGCLERISQLTCILTASSALMKCQWWLLAERAAIRTWTNACAMSGRSAFFSTRSRVMPRWTIFLDLTGGLRQEIMWRMARRRRRSTRTTRLICNKTWRSRHADKMTFCICCPFPCGPVF